jgi:hypothetical protein
MKNICYTVFIFFFVSIQMIWAQQPYQGNFPAEFDPATHPVAVQADSNLILCTVSDYVLVRSLKAQLPGLDQIKDVHCTLHHNKGYLQFETTLSDPQRTPITIFIPLVAAPNGNYYAWSTTGTTCSNCTGTCKPEGTGACGGCCDAVAGLIAPQHIRLKKVATTITLQKE